MASSGRWQSLAAQQAALKFGPQRSALRESALEAQQNYQAAVRAARSTATQTELSAAHARPEIARIYQGALAATQPGVNLVSQALSEPGVPAAFRAAGATESQQQIANLNSASARDQALLHQQGVSARAGAQFAQLNAQSTLQKTIAGLLRKNSSLAEEQGTFASTEAEKLAQEAEKAEQAERASIRSSETSRSNNEESSRTSRENSKEKNARNGSGYVNGVKLATPHEQHAAATTIDEMRGLAHSLFAQGHSRAEVLHILATPVEATHVDESKSHKNKQGGTESESVGSTTKGRGAYAPDVLMSAALDEAQFGGVTKGTLTRLHAAGYSVKALGLRVVSQRSAQVQAGLGPTIRAATKAVTGGY